MLSDLNAFINKKKANTQVNTAVKVNAPADKARQPNMNAQTAAPPVQ